jgi:hypothetical protein
MVSDNQGQPPEGGAKRSRAMTSGRDPSAVATIPPVSTEELAVSALPDADIDRSSRRLLASELEHLRQRREAHGLLPPDETNLTGLALSGGGIRSSTFSLGVLQALAKYKLLEHFDYLSTVSGGGYIGSSLTWWLSPQSGPKPQLERGAFGVGKQDLPYGTDNPAIWRGQPATEPEKDPGPKLLTTLRKHGNYLTPGSGITALSGVAVVLRAVLLNLLVWLPLLVLAMLGLLGVLWALFGAPPTVPRPAPVSEGTLWLLLFDGAVVAGFLVALAGAYFFALPSRYEAATDEIRAAAAKKEGSAGWRARFITAFAEGRLWGIWTAVCGVLVVLLLWLLPPQPQAHWHGLRLLLLGAGILATTFVLLSVVYSWATRLPGHRMRRASYEMRRLFESWAAVYLPLIAVLDRPGARHRAVVEAAGVRSADLRRGRGDARPARRHHRRRCRLPAQRRAGQQAAARVGLSGLGRLHRGAGGSPHPVRRAPDRA